MDTSTLAEFPTDDLRAARAGLEAELLAAFASGEAGTATRFEGIALLTHIGAELLERHTHHPRWEETDLETAYGHTSRLSFSVRVF